MHATPMTRGLVSLAVKLPLLLSWADAAVTTIDVAFTCATGPHNTTKDPGLREECDHIRFTLDALNNKTDGFLDFLLPNIQLRFGNEYAGDCPSTNAEATMQAIYAQMRADSPNLTAVFGGHCSGALMAMSSVEHRAAIGGPQHLFISGSSTAPSAADDVKYPNVARMASSEALIAVAIADLCIDQSDSDPEHVA